MNFDLSKVRLRGSRLIINKPRPFGPDDVHKVGDGTLFAPAISRRLAQTYGHEATVALVGPGCKEEFSVGDKIIVNEFAGTPINIDNQELPYWLVGEEEVACVISE